MHMRLARKIGLQQTNLARRTPGLFKPEFVSTRGVWLNAKSYLNDFYFQRYKDVLDVFLKTRRDRELKDITKAKNVGVRV